MITGIMAGIGALSSGLQALQGAKDKRRAEKALEDYRRQELTNMAEDLTVSTRGADMQQEQQARLQAGQIDALRGAGTRGLIGGLGRVEAGSQQVSQQIGANLDQQQKDIDRQIMQENINLRTMQEQRENADLAALSSQYNSGNQQMWSGFGGIAQSAISGLGAIGEGTEGGDKKPDNDNPESVVKKKTNMNPNNTSDFEYKIGDLNLDGKKHWTESKFGHALSNTLYNLGLSSGYNDPEINARIRRINEKTKYWNPEERLEKWQLRQGRKYKRRDERKNR